MAEATVSIAIETLRDLLVKEAKLLSGVSHEIVELNAELERMKSFLYEADKKQYEDERIRTLLKQIKRAAYKAEDVIEEYSIQVSSKKRRSGVLKRFSRILSKCFYLHKVGSEIASIKNTITNLTASFSTFGIKPLIEGESSTIVGEDKGQIQNWSRQTYPHEVEQYLIEMKDEIKFLVSRLVSNEYQTEGVISIWGMGGSGKTTLAKKIYNHQEIKRCFNAFAWVCITQQCQTRSVMQEMLGKLAPEIKDKIKEMEDRELVEQLYQVQTEKKCLVVLDDIWKIEDWRHLKQCFPNGEGASSKILLTTRNKNVAEIGFEHQIRSLTEDEGWELLKKRAFPKEAGLGEGSFMRLGKYMVRKCGYLPLAIAVLGGILSRKASFNEWELVSKDIDLYLKKGEGKGEQRVVERVLALSYDDLPYHLKSCFLYLGFLREDESVDAVDLYNLWMGEGMILSKHRERQETLLDVAEQYLGELANRCMVLVEKCRDDDDDGGGGDGDGFFGKFASCRLHDVMRDFCQSKCKEEEFINIVDARNPIISSTSFENACRVAIINGKISNGNNEEIFGQQRSLRSLVMVNIKISPPVESIGNFGRFKLLRALFIQKCDFRSGDDLDGIGELIHLRYLGLIYCLVGRLPSSFITLSFLHTLDMKGTEIGDLPSDDIFCKMKRLRYFRIPLAIYGLNGRELILRDFYELEILILNNNDYGVDFRGFVGSKNLRILQVNVNSFEALHGFLDFLISSRGNFINLRWSSITIRRCHLDSTVIKTMLTCKNLHGIRICQCRIPKLPDDDQLEDADLSPSLERIGFYYCSTMEDPLPMLGRLPNLKNLELHLIVDEVSEWGLSARGFPQLVKFYLHVYGSEFNYDLRIDDDAMPNLSEFYLLSDRPKTFEAPARIKELIG